MGGHRRYDLSHLRAQAQGREYRQAGPASSSRVTIGYARVSSPDHLADLQRQIGVLEIDCATRGWSCEIVQDRLMRFGAELVFALCEHFGTEVVVLNAAEERTFEEDLVHDVLEIIAVVSARLYGSRSHTNKQVMQQLKEVADEISRQNSA